MSFFVRRPKSIPDQIETVVGASANLRGTLRSDGGVRVDGAFEGLIESAGNVVVGEAARVIADIAARNVTVAGAVKGNVDATGRLEILSTGVVYGDVQVSTVMIDEGGQLHGVSRMRGLHHPALAAPLDLEPAADEGRPGEATLEGTARHAPEDDEPAPPAAEPKTAPKVAEAPRAGLDVDFDLDELDIEPVIPETNHENETPATRRATRSRRRSAG